MKLLVVNVQGPFDTFLDDGQEAVGIVVEATLSDGSRICAATTRTKRHVLMRAEHDKSGKGWMTEMTKEAVTSIVLKAMELE